MEWQNFIDAAIAVVSALFGWFFKIVWDAIKELKDEMKDISTTLHKEYVRKDDYHIEMAKIETMFQRIMDKLDGKADKQ